MEATHLVSDKTAPLQYRDGEDLLPIPFAGDEASQGAAAGAGQYPEIRREGHFFDQLGHPGNGERAAAPFRHYQGIGRRKLGQPVGVLTPPVTLAVDKNEIHAPAFCCAQGGVADGLCFTTYDAGSSQARLTPSCRQRMNVVGIGTAKREQVLHALFPGMLQLVLEFAPLVARDGRVDQVISFAPELDVVLPQQRVEDGFQWRGQPGWLQGKRLRAGRTG